MDDSDAQQEAVVCTVKLQKNKKVSAVSLHGTLHVNDYAPLIYINTTNYKSTGVTPTYNTTNTHNELSSQQFVAHCAACRTPILYGKSPSLLSSGSCRMVVPKKNINEFMIF